MAAVGVLLAVVAVAFGGGRGYGEGSMQVEERAEAAVAAMDVTAEFTRLVGGGDKKCQGQRTQLIHWAWRLSEGASTAI